MPLFKMAAAGFALLGSAMSAQAGWPEQPIEMVCATDAGSGAANWCLLMAELVGNDLGQPINVLFKPAGAGNEAATYVAQRPADGYTWLQRNTSYGGYMNLPTHASCSTNPTCSTASR
jgi:tripartite-type tricarboxylate transporter receptor subunit TctC